MYPMGTHEGMDSQTQPEDNAGYHHEELQKEQQEWIQWEHVDDPPPHKRVSTTGEKIGSSLGDGKPRMIRMTGAAAPDSGRLTCRRPWWQAATGPRGRHGNPSMNQNIVFFERSILYIRPS
jgi:hypothetical protein